MSDQFLVGILGGVMSGAVYAVVGLSFTLMFRANGSINFAQGEVAMVGALVGALLGVHTGWMMVPAALLVVAVGGALGLFVYLLVARLREPVLLNSLILTFGISMLIQSVVRLWRGDEIFVLPTFLGAPSALRVSGTAAAIPGQFIWVSLCWAVMLVLTLYVMNKTSYGMRLRAVSSDRIVAEAIGISSGRAVMIAFAASGGLAAIAGFVTSPSVYLNYSGGLHLTIFGLIAAIIGGLRRPEGAALGGLILGLSESFAATFGSPQYANLVSVALLLLVLLVRPAGLLRDPLGAHA